MTFLSNFKDSLVGAKDKYVEQLKRVQSKTTIQPKPEPVQPEPVKIRPLNEIRQQSRVDIFEPQPTPEPVKPSKLERFAQKTVDVIERVPGHKLIEDLGTGFTLTGQKATQAIASGLKIAADDGSLQFYPGTESSELQPKREEGFRKTLNTFANKVFDKAKGKEELIKSQVNNQLISGFSQGGVSIALATGVGLLGSTAKGLTIAQQVKRASTASGLLFASMESLPIFTESRRSGKTKEESLAITAAHGTGTFVLEKFGIDFMFGNMGKKFVSNRLANAIGRGIIGGTGEAVQENLQNAWQQLVEKQGFKGFEGETNTDKVAEIFEGWTDTAIISFTLGGVLGGVGGDVSFQQQQGVQTKIDKTINEIQKELDISKGEAQDVFNQLRAFAIESKDSFAKSFSTLKNDTRGSIPVDLLFPGQPQRPELGAEITAKIQGFENEQDFIDAINAGEITEAETDLIDKHLGKPKPRRRIEEVSKLFNRLKADETVLPVTQLKPSLREKEEEKERAIPKRIRQNELVQKLNIRFDDDIRFKTLRNEDQAEAAINFMEASPSDATDIALGIKPAPTGILNTAIREAVVEKAIAEGDVKLITKLGNNTLFSGKITEMGQEIQFLSRKLPGDPIVAIEDLVNTRAKIAEQRLKKTDKNLAAATKRIKTVEENQRRRIIREVNQESLSQAKTWDDFVQAIQC